MRFALIGARRAVVVLHCVALVAGCSRLDGATDTSGESPNARVVATVVSRDSHASTPFTGVGRATVIFGDTVTEISGILCSRTNDVFQAVGETADAAGVHTIRVIGTSDATVFVSDASGKDWVNTSAVTHVDGDLIEIDGSLVSGTESRRIHATIECGL